MKRRANNRALRTIAFALMSCLFGCDQKPRVISTANAPKPVGPYVQAIVAKGTVYGAGQLGINPASGRIEATTADGQMEQALINMFAVLKAAGSDPCKVTKLTVYFKNLDDLEKVNKVYEQKMGPCKPGRAAIEAARLPLDALIEIDYIAVE